MIDGILIYSVFYVLLTVCQAEEIVPKKKDAAPAFTGFRVECF